jgi:glutathione S-transferase
MLELYHSGLTTCSKQVRHCLREKGLTYASRYVELWRYENLSPAYLAINPNGVVPTLVHDGVPVINSFCINEYIEDAFPDPPLRPADAQARARMRYWTWTADEIHLSLARLTHALVLQPAVAAMPEAERDMLLAATPVPEKRARWRTITHGQHSQEQLQAALDNVLFVFARMEAELPWLAGSKFSLAEISMAAIVHRVFELYPERIDRGAAAAQRLVGPHHGAPRRGLRLCRRHRRDPAASGGQVDRWDHRVSDRQSRRIHFRNSSGNEPGPKVP